MKHGHLKQPTSTKKNILKGNIQLLLDDRITNYTQKSSNMLDVGMNTPVLFAVGHICFQS